MNDFTALALLISEFPVYSGYAPTNAVPPYGVLRPISYSSTDIGRPVSGRQWTMDVSIGLYCVAGSAAASLNMALDALTVLDGHNFAGTQLLCQLMYNGAFIDGRYETLVTINYTEGVIA